MRPFSTMLVVAALALVSSVATATSTTPHKVNTSLIPQTCLGSSGLNQSPPDLVAYPCNRSPPAGYQPSNSGLMVKWNASQADLGWDYLAITMASTNFCGERCHYEAGWLEGYMTAERIGYYVQSNQAAISAEASSWVEEHIAWMKAQVKQKKNLPFETLWAQVDYSLNQLEGIAAGYNMAVPGGANVSMTDIFLLNFVDELGDVDIAIKVQSGKIDKNKMLNADQLGHIGSHCSALIKPTKDDLFVAHDTWDTFTGLAHRIYKVYNFNFRAISFSSYPGQIVSNDDWYQITSQSHAMVVQETTNVIFNTSLYMRVQPQAISEFLRVAAANAMAQSPEQWTEIFSRHNSGTYNNQYMVVDFLRYTPGSNVVPGTFWIAEQIPGLVERGDMSDVLNKKGYWASYNIPYFWNIFDISGYKAQVEKVGNFWSYSKYARPEIFRRNNTEIHDLASMMRMMRYNNWQTDPFSQIPNCQGADAACNTTHTAMLSIASRGDLVPLYPTKAEMIQHYGPLYGFVAQGCFGALDSKIANWKNRGTLTNHVISGPTNDQQPTFSWGSTVCPMSKMPAGSPPTFDFPWLEVVNSDLVL